MMPPMLYLAERMKAERSNRVLPGLPLEMMACTVIVL